LQEKPGNDEGFRKKIAESGWSTDKDREAEIAPRMAKG
jgi:hypothetical protein